MNAKQTALRNKQRERQQRGEDFQKEIRNSWRYVPNIWRMRIADGKGGARPADEITTTEQGNILAELKRTEGKEFSLNFMRPNQITGLIDFDEAVSHNKGLVFVSFHNPAKSLDETYAFRLITALKYMKKNRKHHIKLEDFQNNSIPCVHIQRLSEYVYDLSEVVKHCRSL